MERKGGGGLPEMEGLTSRSEEGERTPPTEVPASSLLI